MKQTHLTLAYSSENAALGPACRPGLVGDDALVHLMQVVPHADGQPVAQLPAVHGVHHPEHLSSGKAQADGVVRLVIKVGAYVEVVGKVGLYDLLIN